jgi:hypothetical protein
MNLYRWFLAGLSAALVLLVASCAQPAQGTLEFRANGEDFVRQGFVSKDGWAIDFNHLYVTLADLTAYQSDPPYDPAAGSLPTADIAVSLAEPVTVDLAAGAADAAPILVGERSAPAGRYNALSWQMMPAAAGDAAGSTLVLDGTASRDGETVAFVLRLDEALIFTCGDFVGDTRKGILEAGQTAEVEATFHFDHLFGDAEAAPDDSINTGALGFDPLAALATAGTLEIDQAGLREHLSADEYALLESILPGLGHTGEGHCALQPQAASE